MGAAHPSHTYGDRACRPPPQDNENWDGVLYSHMAAFGGSSSIFFLIAIFVGNIMFLNMFLSILCEVSS